MRKLSALAFATVIALVLAGCGGGGGSSSASGASSSNIGIKTDSQGFSTETKFVDAESGKVVTRISEITSDATGDVPTAPTLGGTDSAPEVK